jgi:hypothetical protein
LTKKWDDLGAMKRHDDQLTGEILLNLDSEEDDEITVDAQVELMTK